MSACLSGKHKKKRRKNSKKISNDWIANSYLSLNGLIKYDSEYEWMQQQKLLISRVHLKPDQYLILSQKEIHDTIEKVINKYPNKIINWHWINGRFEPVIFDHETNINININGNATQIMQCNHSINSNNNNNNNTKKHLLRMNGNYLIKCKSCFRKTMKREYMTQKDILFLIKYCLKLFIEYQTQNKYKNKTQQIQIATQANNYNNEMTKFHSNFKYSKPLLPNLYPPNNTLLITNDISDTQTQTTNDYFVPIQYHNNNNNKNNNNNSLSTLSGLSGVAITRHNELDEYQSVHNVFDVISNHSNNNNIDTKKSKSKHNMGKKELKEELNRIQQDYRCMLKDYNNLQNFMIRKGIHYDPIKDSANIYGAINGNIRNLDLLKSENESLLMQIQHIKNEKIELQNKFMLSRNEQNRLKNENIHLKSVIEELQQINYINNNNNINNSPSNHSNHSNHSIIIHNNNNNNDMDNTNSSISALQTLAINTSSSDDDDDEVKMLQRILPQNTNDNTFYTELTTLYDNNNNNNNQLTELDEYEYESEHNNNRNNTSSILDILTTNTTLANSFKRKSKSYKSDIRMNNRNNNEMRSCNRTRSRSQSNSLLPVNSVHELRKEENLILQNEFDLFRLLIDDRTDEETLNLNSEIKKRRGSVNRNYLGIDALIDHVTNPNIFDIDTLVNFLPLILFKASKFEKEIQSLNKMNKHVPTTTNYANILISRLSKVNRLWQNHDIRQKLQFLSNSFSSKHNNCINKNEKYNYYQIKNIFDNSYKIWQQKQTEKNDSLQNENEKKSNQNGNDLILFWENILNLSENDIQIIDYENDSDAKYSFFYRDPVTANYPPLRKVKVCKQLKSANKPLLCELWVQKHEEEKADTNHNLFLSSHIILKKGDDLRKDYAIMNIFKYMNSIWKKERENNRIEFENLSYENSIVKILTFNIVAISPSFGAIELISNCVPLRHVLNLQSEMKNEHFYQLITSAAASYIASFVCGVRDRHFENILIRVADCTLFHIDFGYCVGETIKFSLDASPFGITNTLKDLMNYNSNVDLYNEKFIPICVDAYMALRKNYKSLIKFAQLAFSYVKKENDIENFLKNRLKIFDATKNQNRNQQKWKNTKYVKQWLTKKLMTAPKDQKTIRKNKLRKFLSPTMVDLDKKINI